MKMEIIGAIVLGVVVLGLVLWYMNENPTPYVNRPLGTVPGNNLNTQSVPVSLGETATYYDIIASYPSSAGLTERAGATADAQAVALMKQFEMDSIASFKKDGNFANLSHDDVQLLGLDQRKESLEIKYESTVGPHTLSYIYTTYADTHGAHPNTYFRTFTFDRKTGINLALSDIFLPNADYLSVLTEQSRKILVASIAAREGVKVTDVDMDYLRRGTGPDADNFANWHIEGTSLVLIFPPYQVAPYAAGVQTAVIPFSQLSSILNPAYK